MREECFSSNGICGMSGSGETIVEEMFGIGGMEGDAIGEEIGAGLLSD